MTHEPDSEDLEIIDRHADDLNEEALDDIDYQIALESAGISAAR